MLKSKIVIGGDETGVGDYLSPLVCAAVFVPPSNYSYFRKIGITDSKKLSNQKIMTLFGLIKDKIKSSVRSLSQTEYNELNKIYNANELKMLLHLRAINALSSRLAKVDAIIIDQFASKKNLIKYQNHLVNNEKDLQNFLKEPLYVEKGESYHISVATASIVARAHLLVLMEKQNQKWAMNFPLGTNKIVEEFARQFIKVHGQKHLNEVAKLSFKTTQKILSTNLVKKAI